MECIYAIHGRETRANIVGETAIQYLIQIGEGPFKGAYFYIKKDGLIMKQAMCIMDMDINNNNIS